MTQGLSVICGIRTPVCVFASIYRRKLIFLLMFVYVYAHYIPDREGSWEES